MKSANMIKCIIVTVLATSISQLATAHSDSNVKYVYQGDEDARAICMAIAQDKVYTLKRALKNKKYSKLDRDVHERYECNDMNLHAFAKSMRSETIVAYLAPHFDNVSDVKVAGLK